jgi:hypothetical protein
MGTQLFANCGCGFQADLNVGGGQLHPEDPFPFYCRKCGLVSVCVGDSESKDRCPTCASPAILPYGEPPVSRRVGSYKVASLYDLSLTPTQHLCPSCKQMTLAFEQGAVRLDRPSSFNQPPAELLGRSSMAFCGAGP